VLPLEVFLQVRSAVKLFKSKFGGQLRLSYTKNTLGWRAADWEVLLHSSLGRHSLLCSVGAFPDANFANQRLLTAGECSNSNNSSRPTTTLLFHVISRKAEQCGNSVLSFITQTGRVSLWRFRSLASVELPLDFRYRLLPLIGGFDFYQDGFAYGSYLLPKLATGILVIPINGRSFAFGDGSVLRAYLLFSY
jgi:hypothetical protein